MLLKVGELASRTNLTVRTLHHYDKIGLLKPSARSEAAYRLYNHQDIARLHAILALRQFDLSLSDIAQVFLRNGVALPSVLLQQLETLQRQIAESTVLLSRLELLQTQLASGESPQTNDWLETLARMSTYGKHFSAPELKQILEQRSLADVQWNALFADVRQAMDRRIHPESLEVQPLAQRWLGLMYDWMGGDFDMMSRWSEMYRTEPTVFSAQNPSPQMVKYMTIAIDLRKAAFLRHMNLDELKQVRPLSTSQWGALAHDMEILKKRRESPSCPSAKLILQRWAAMALEQTGQNRVVLAKMLLAIRAEPVLQVAADKDTAVRDFLRQAMRVHGDPFAVNPVKA
jgi:DNA-binding transcriptional MerR regulator